MNSGLASFDCASTCFGIPCRFWEGEFEDHFFLFFFLKERTLRAVESDNALQREVEKVECCWTNRGRDVKMFISAIVR